jgi:hypothetical protein
MYGEDSGGRRYAPSSAGAFRRLATIGPRPAGFGGGGAPGLGSGGVLGMRARQEYDTPDLSGQEEQQQWLEAQRTLFDAVAGATAAADAVPAGGAALPAADGVAATDAARGTGGEGSSSKQQRGRHSAQHATIFTLVYGLLDDGDDRR